MRSVLLLLALSSLLIASPALATVRAVDGGIRFEHTDPGAASVSLAGSFNDWSTTATPMSDPDGDGTWTVVVPLAKGSYEYKFVVNNGTWLADPGNPRTGGDYGNSLLDVDDEGRITAAGGAVVIPSGTAVLSNNTLNSRVYLGGFFRVFMEATTDTPGDDRLRLDRPDDQYNFDPVMNLNQRLWASARLQVRTGDADANELAMELYKAQANFIDDAWSVQAFYNEEAYESTDPFGLLGHEDLRGVIRRQDRPFGQGHQGLALRAEPFGGSFSAMYSDTYDEDIFNLDLPNLVSLGIRNFDQRTGTDVLGLRYERPVGPLHLGGSYRGTMSDWWVNFTIEDNPLPEALQDHQAEQVEQGRDPNDQVSEYYELSNDHHVFAADARMDLLEGLSGFGAFGYTWYRAEWSVGNKEDVQGNWFDDGALGIGIGNQRGLRSKEGLDWEWKGLTASASHEYRFQEGMDLGEEAIFYRTQPGTMVADMDPWAMNQVLGRYVQINGQQGTDVLRVGPSPELRQHLARLDAGYRYRDWRAELGVEFGRENLGYSNFFGAGAADLERSSWRVSPGLSWHFDQDERYHLSLDSQVSLYDDPDELVVKGGESLLNFSQPEDPARDSLGDPQESLGYLLRMDQIELILRGLVPLGALREKGLALRFDLRWTRYDGPSKVAVRRADADLTTEEQWVESLVDLDGDFFMPFAALVWKPADPVEFQIGYGVDPIYYNTIDPAGWPNGRQRWRENYLMDRALDPYHPYNILMAEDAMESRSQLVLNAFVRF